MVSLTRIAPLLLTAAGLIACAGSARATGHPHPETEAGARKVEVQKVEAQKDAQRKDQNVVIRGAGGGRANVVIDGKEIEGAVRVITKDGVVTILDGEGNVLREIKIPEMPGNFAFRFGEDGEMTFGEGADLSWNAGGLFGDRPVIGIELEEIDEALASQLRMVPGQRMVIRSVVEGSPAQAVGIEAHDVVLRIADRDVRNLEDIQGVLATKAPGDELGVVVLRAGGEKTFTVKLAPSGRLSLAGPGGGLLRSDEGVYNFRVDEERARAMQERALNLQREAEIQSGLLRKRFDVDLDRHARERVTVEMLEKVRALDADQRRRLESNMDRVRKAMQELELHLQLPEIEILELDDPKNRVVVVPTPEVRGQVHVAPRVRTPGPGAAPTWSEGDSRIERLEERVAKIESLIERILQKLEERER